MIHKINRKVNELLLYKTTAQLLNIIYNLKLTRTQMYLLAELIFYNNKYKMIDKEERPGIALNTENRKAMVNRLGIEAGTFNNMITSFRIKGILKDKTLNEQYCIYPEESNKFEITLNVKR